MTRYVLEHPEGKIARTFDRPQWFVFENVRYGPSWFKPKNTLGLKPVESRANDFDPVTHVPTGTEIVEVDGVWVARPVTRAKTEVEIDSWRTDRTAALVNAIKAEAGRRILLIAREHEQRNLLARAAILAKTGEADWTAEEAAEWTWGEAIWTRIKALRDASDDLEAGFEALTEAELASFDPAEDLHWPE